MRLSNCLSIILLFVLGACTNDDITSPTSAETPTFSAMATPYQISNSQSWETWSLSWASSCGSPNFQGSYRVHLASQFVIFTDGAGQLKQTINAKAWLVNQEGEIVGTFMQVGRTVQEFTLNGQESTISLRFRLVTRGSETNELAVLSWKFNQDGTVHFSWESDCRG